MEKANVRGNEPPSSWFLSMNKHVVWTVVCGPVLGRKVGVQRVTSKLSMALANRGRKHS